MIKPKLRPNGAYCLEPTFMRKITVIEFISLDGVIQAPGGVYESGRDPGRIYDCN